MDYLVSGQTVRRGFSLLICFILLSSVFSVSVLAVELPPSPPSSGDAGLPQDAGYMEAQPVEPVYSEPAGQAVDSAYLEPSEASVQGEQTVESEPARSVGIQSASTASVGVSEGGEPAPYLPGVAVVAESPIQSEGFFEAGLYTGAATYSIPIKLSPGTAGLAPQIALSYSSQGAKGAAGPVGLGWSLTGSYVVRDVNYTPDDASDDEYDLVLNGQKHDLVYVGEILGGTASQFKTKIDSHMHIYLDRLGSACNNINDYCMRWVVRTKDGTTYVFGFSRDSELGSVNRNYAVRWSLNSIEDTHGNKIYFEYLEDQGVSYPSKIEYNNDLRRDVEFVWEPRPDAHTSYHGGTKTMQAKRLKAVNVTADGSLVRTYYLTYQLNDAQTKSLLTSIRECGSDGTTCQPETKFTYYPSAAGWPQQTGWDIPVITGASALGGDSAVIDVNGDGRADIIKAFEQYGGLQSFAWINTGSGWNIDYNYAPPAYFNYYVGQEAADVQGRLGDVNGDGLVDMIPAHKGSNWVWINTGAGWQKTFGYNVPVDIHGEWGVQLSDVNGDGLDDIIVASKHCVSGYGCKNHVIKKEVWLNTGNTWTFDETWTVPEEFFFTQYGQSSVDTGGRILDVNADGLPDLVQQGRWYANGVWLNTGSGWEASTDYSFPDLLDSKSYTRLVDVNADGLVDVLKAYECLVFPNGQEQITLTSDAWINTGSGWTDTSEWASPTGFHQICFQDMSGPTSATFGDVNGDGFSDLLRRDSDSRPSFAWFNGNHQAPAVDVLRSVENSLGGRVDVEYTPSTAFDNRGGDGVSDLRFPVLVVSSITEDNGLSGEHGVVFRRDFTYASGYYDTEDKEFRGFNQVTEIDDGIYRIHNFHQDDARKGMEYNTLVWEDTDSGWILYSWISKDWSSTPNNGVFEVSLDRVTENTYSGVFTSWSNKKTRVTEFEYDNYGNIVKTSFCGEGEGPSLIPQCDQSGDEKYEYTEYAYNTGTWIVNRPSHTVLKAADDATVYSESWFQYNTQGDLVREEHLLDSGSNPVSTYSHDSFGNLVSGTDPLGRTTSYSYDSSGTYLASETNALSHVTEYSYDFKTGNLNWVEDANDYRTSFGYDSLGRIISEKRPFPGDPGTASYTYFTDGVAPEGVKVSRKEGLDNPYGMLDSYTFVDGFGRVVQSRADAVDGETQVVVDSYYDGLGRVSRQSVPYFSGSHSSYQNPDSAVKSTSYSYDPLDRVVEVVNTDGSRKLVDYDHWVTTVTDENNHEKTYLLDAYRRVTEVREKNGGETYFTSYAYTPRDELKSIIDNQGYAFLFTYDSLSRKTGMDDPDLGVWSYSYDSVGNLVGQTDGRGVSVAFNYDALNRVTNVDYPSDADVSYNYDSPTKGALSSVSGGFGSVSFEYNRRLQPVKETWSANGRTWVKQYAWDSLDRLYWTTHPDGSVTQVHFNDQGLPATLGGVSFTYDAFGRMTGKNYGNGLETTLEFYPDDFRLKNIKTPGMQDLSYAYDDVGNVLSITSAAGESYTQTYTYDGLDRLTQATESGGFDLSFKYDATGNLLEINDSGVATTYTYGTGNSPGPHAVVEIQAPASQGDCSGSLPPAVGNWIVNSPTLCRLSTIILSLGSKLSVTGGNQVTLQDTTLNLDGDIQLDGNLVLDGPDAGVSFGGNSGVGTQGASASGTQVLTYDNSGSLTSGFDQSYEYDDANRLRTVSKAGGVVESYIYDYNGQRFKKVSGGETTYYIGKDYQTVVNSSGTYNTIYYYANNELVGKKEGGAMSYYHNDHLGGTHVVTDGNGNEVTEERTRYKPFGGIISGGESRNLYTGQEWDASTGQYYYGARYYNPELRRFAQADTHLQNVYDPQILNRYTYTRNNPLKYIDPTGHDIVCFQVDAEASYLLGVTGTANNVETGCPASTCIAYDPETKIIEVGKTDSIGFGIGTPTAAIKQKIVYAAGDKYKQISDLKGWAVVTNVDKGYFGTVSAGIITPLTEEGLDTENNIIFGAIGVPDWNAPFPGSGSASLVYTDAWMEKWYTADGANKEIYQKLYNQYTQWKNQVQQLQTQLQQNIGTSNWRPWYLGGTRTKKEKEG